MIQRADRQDNGERGEAEARAEQSQAPRPAGEGGGLVFNGSEEPTLGMEVEVPVLDRETGELAPGSPRLLAACRDEGIENVSAELMQSMLEVRTGICRTVSEMRDELLPRLRRVRNLGLSMGYDLAMLATHPSARPNENVLFPDDRFASAEKRLAWMIYHRVTFGLHVHVGVRSGDEAVGLMNILLQYLPHLLAVSGNSPFWQGIDTGLASARAMLYGLVVHAGVPPRFTTWKDFRGYVQTMRDCNVLRSHKDVKWDIRPRADLGTIEFRICDTPASMSHALALAALTRALVVFGQRLLKQKPQARMGDERRLWITKENKWLAARFGLDASYISAPAGTRRSLRQEVGELATRLLPIAREFGDDRFLAPLNAIDRFETGAARQRRIYRETGQWKAVIDDSITRLVEELDKHHAAKTAAR
jgi:glutamate---cysteine ligase / carboxylate-amine ligase